MIDKDILALINRRQRQILTHSCLYYKMDINLIQDHEYDALAHDLYRLMQEYPKEFKESALYEDYKNYDGGSGFLLPYNRPNVVATAMFLYKYKPNQ